jgi:hypothetical protein
MACKDDSQTSGRQAALLTAADGLRKAAARRLAEAGATPHQVAAVTGHKSLDEIERYTREAAQPGLAATAIRKIE